MAVLYTFVSHAGVHDAVCWLVGYKVLRRNMVTVEFDIEVDFVGKVAQGGSLRMDYVTRTIIGWVSP